MRALPLLTDVSSALSPRNQGEGNSAKGKKKKRKNKKLVQEHNAQQSDGDDEGENEIHKDESDEEVNDDEQYAKEDSDGDGEDEDIVPAMVLGDIEKDHINTKMKGGKGRNDQARSEKLPSLRNTGKEASIQQSRMASTQRHNNEGDTKKVAATPASKNGPHSEKAALTAGLKAPDARLQNDLVNRARLSDEHTTQPKIHSVLSVGGPVNPGRHGSDKERISKEKRGNPQAAHATTATASSATSASEKQGKGVLPTPVRRNDSDVLSAIKDDGRVVKIRGLPWEVTREDIVHFFASLEICPEAESVSIALNFDGRPTGDGFVCFMTPEHATLALQR